MFITYNKTHYDFVFKLKVQQSDRKILFKENFKEIKRTKDSIIYSYKFEVKIHEKNTTHFTFIFFNFQSVQT